MQRKNKFMEKCWGLRSRCPLSMGLGWQHFRKQDEEEAWAGVRGESSGGWRLRSELSEVTAVSWGQVSTWEMGTVSCGCKQGYS